MIIAYGIHNCGSDNNSDKNEKCVNNSKVKSKIEKVSIKSPPHL